MRKKSKINLIIITLAIALAFLSINNYNIIDDQGNNGAINEIQDESNLKSPSKSGSYSESFIHIDGNWSHTVGNYTWCSGDGSWGNPYVIENVIIDASSSPAGSGIFINNSKNNYFIIKNCTVFDAGVGAEDAGIRLENTDNGTLIDNYYSNNGRNGIFLHNYCKNSTILGNTANYNGELGIVLSGDCDNNTISGNTANNNHYGIWLDDRCHANIISGNTANDNLDGGMILQDNCDNNTISGNIVNDNFDVGMKLHDNCVNNTISGNIASNEATLDQDMGILLESGCNYTTITGNLILNNTLYGISITTGCQNNSIYYNSFIGTIGGHAHDEGTNNHWDNSIVGNYWVNHTSPDLGDDGIVDDPYTWISGVANSEDHFPLVETPVHLGEKIHIDDSGANAWRWSKTAKLKWWCTGTGTKYDPYVIDGLEIDGGGSGNGIFIQVSYIYFIIKNCIVYNAYRGTLMEDVDNGAFINNNCSHNEGDGIVLWALQYSDCQNNTISGNTANNNENDGIFIAGNCYYNNISGNTVNNNNDNGIYLDHMCNVNNILENTVNNNGDTGIYLNYNCGDNDISGNTVNNNGDEGIYLDDSDNQNTISGNTVINNRVGTYIWDCHSNLIYNNFFIDNIKNADDDGSDNHWDNGGIGNHWSDYPGKDANDDGFGDTPYNISGDADSQDNYPFWWDPIAFSIITSNPNDAFSHTAPDFTITINEGILNTLWYTIDEGLTNIPCNTSDKITQTTWDDLDDGNFTLTCSATDFRGYLTMNSIIIQKDTVAPNITLNSPTPNQICKKEPPDFNVSIIEENLFSTWYTIESIAENFTFTELNGTIDQTAWNNVLKGEVSITFYAQDKAGTTGSVSVVVIKRIPSKPPFAIIIIASVSIAGGLGVAVATIVLLRKRKRTSEVK
ncbi:MAG: right-handed parallel beta-helix repeat-containing protein [Candidatus Lokiarchaeota archaeon]|nr:right-handed parallel beta-helix repeat-containing protein [Candidatus Lokiarchaeota archaeon]